MNQTVSAYSAETQTRPIMTAYNWYVVITLTMLNTVAYLDRFVMAIQIVPLKRSMSLSDTKLGLLYGFGFVLLYAIAGLYAGLLADRLNRKRIIVAGCILWTVATMAGAFTSSFGTLLGSRVVVGIAESTLIPAGVSLMGAYVIREKLGLANGIFFLGATLGKSFAYVGGGLALGALTIGGGLYVADHHFEAWQGLFLLCGIPGAVALLLIAGVREPDRPKATAGVTIAYGALWQYMKDHRLAFALFFMCGICSSIIAHVVAAWTPSYFVRAYDMNVTDAGVMVGTVGLIAGVVGGLSGGVITDRISATGSSKGPAIVLIGSLIVMAPAGLVAFNGHTSPKIAALAFGFVQAAITMGLPQAWVGVQAMTPQAYRGMMSALFLCLTSILSTGLGPLVIGLWSDYFYVGSMNSVGLSIISAMAVLIAIGIATGIASGKPLHELSRAIRDGHGVAVTSGK